MSNLAALLKKLKEQAKAPGRTRSISSDPAKGLEYNEISGNYRVSGKLFKVDIARTPQVIREIGEWVDVHGEAWKANADNSLVNYRAGRVHGRGR